MLAVKGFFIISSGVLFHCVFACPNDFELCKAVLNLFRLSPEYKEGQRSFQISGMGSGVTLADRLPERGLGCGQPARLRQAPDFLGEAYPKDSG